MILPKIPKNWQTEPFTLPLVEVTWYDATVKTGWMEWSEVEAVKPAVIKTVGFLLPPDKDFVRLAPTVGRDPQYADVWLIPQGWIEKVRRLR